MKHRKDPGRFITRGKCAQQTEWKVHGKRTVRRSDKSQHGSLRPSEPLP